MDLKMCLEDAPIHKIDGCCEKVPVLGLGYS
jgi:hypothetical protein